MLAAGPKQQVAIQREVEFAARTTLRVQLKRLFEAGTVSKRRRNRFPGTLEYELSPAGASLLFVADLLERWLQRAPDGPMPLGGNAAKAAIKALTEAWSTTLLRVLASGPSSLTELDSLISSLSYPALERRLAAMRLAGLAEPRPTDRRGSPQLVTRWAREAMGPIAAAARWERLHRPAETPPVTCLDIEALILLCAPLLQLPSDASGSCRLVADFGGDPDRLGGAMVAVEHGRGASCTTDLRRDADAWAYGSPHAWLDALARADTAGLELGGNYGLVLKLIEALKDTLLVANPENSGRT